MTLILRLLHLVGMVHLTDAQFQRLSTPEGQVLSRGLATGILADLSKLLMVPGIALTGMYFVATGPRIETPNAYQVDNVGNYLFDKDQAQITDGRWMKTGGKWSIKEPSAKLGRSEHGATDTIEGLPGAASSMGSFHAGSRTLAAGVSRPWDQDKLLTEYERALTAIPDSFTPSEQEALRVMLTSYTRDHIIKRHKKARSSDSALRVYFNFINEIRASARPLDAAKASKE